MCEAATIMRSDSTTLRPYKNIYQFGLEIFKIYIFLFWKTRYFKITSRIIHKLIIKALYLKKLRQMPQIALKLVWVNCQPVIVGDTLSKRVF